jgi:hypothetical protein
VMEGVRIGCVEGSGVEWSRGIRCGSFEREVRFHRVRTVRILREMLIKSSSSLVKSVLSALFFQSAWLAFFFQVCTERGKAVRHLPRRPINSKKSYGQGDHTRINSI